MTQSALFCRGIELASFLTSSAVLRKPWDVITSRYAGIITTEGEGISWKVFREPGLDLMVLAFDVTQDSSKLQSDLVPSNALREKNLHHFEFLRTKKDPFFSVNSTAISLFLENYEELDQLKSEINSSTKLIVTGHGLGGLVASLFTISLLNSIGLGKNRPLCITFGSPLIGDKKLQQAISRSSNWNSCFLHVVSLKDPLPRLFITKYSSSPAALTPQTSAYMPFGTFFLCSDANSTCFENPDSILELLIAMGSIHTQNQEFQSADYGNIVEKLSDKVICKDFSTRVENMAHAGSVLASSISLQLQALALTPHLQQNIDTNTLETKIKIQEQKFILQRRVFFDPAKKLNQMKQCMSQLEWYKKETKNHRIGYYDSYKNMNSLWDYDVMQFHKMLTNYWKDMVEEAKIHPQKASAAFRRSWMRAGTNYRRMVEPLDIAQYYRDGGKDYVTENRPEHFVLLEEWHRKEMTKANTSQEEDGICDWDRSWNWGSYWDWHRIVDEYLPSSQGLMVDEAREEAISSTTGYSSRVNQLLLSPNGLMVDEAREEAISSTTGYSSRVNQLLLSPNGLMVDEAREEAISSTTGYSSRVNQLLLSTNGLNHEENEENVNTTNKNNDKNNSYYEACVDELLVSCQGSDKEQKINKYESHVDEAVLSRQGSLAIKDLQELFNRTKKKNMQTILTRDSCFWAHVEEARISCNVLKVIKEKEETFKKLVEFEEYVYELLEKYEVSSDIFLRGSSYICWWNEYKAIKGTSYDSKLANFMNDVRNYEQYALGEYDFP